MMDSKVIKIIGIASTILGLGATLLSGWVGDKKTEMQIDKLVTEKVNEVLTIND